MTTQRKPDVLSEKERADLTLVQARSLSLHREAWDAWQDLKTQVRSAKERGATVRELCVVLDLPTHRVNQLLR